MCAFSKAARKPFAFDGIVHGKAPFLPHYTRFASGNWADSRARWDGPGEVLEATRSWSNGETPPSAQALHVCGLPHEWADGLELPAGGPTVTYDAFGIPICCGVAIVGDGGPGLYGAAGRATNLPWSGDGGASWMDCAELQGNFAWIGDGGAAIDGRVFAQLGRSIILGDGGPQLDGAAGVVWIPYQLGDGGPAMDGAAGAYWSTFVGDGGPQLGGAAGVVWSLQPIGNGGPAMDGAAALVSFAAQIGDGGPAMDRAAGILVPLLSIGDGGPQLDGAAGILVPLLSIGDGGPQLDGAAVAAAFTGRVGDGGPAMDGAAPRLIRRRDWQRRPGDGRRGRRVSLRRPGRRRRPGDGWNVYEIVKQTFRRRHRGRMREGKVAGGMFEGKKLCPI